MELKVMVAFNDQLLRIVEDYRAAGEPWPATRDQIAEWAVAHDRYQLTRGMAVSQCAEKISRAMGLEHVKDKKGRSVRKYYSARIRENGQLVMKWDDQNAERPFMEVSAANRRNQVLGQCWQLKQDIDSYSEQRCPERPIQIDFNFNIDLEELGQLSDIA
jgi:plasmid maintenance system killer protein